MAARGGNFACVLLAGTMMSSMDVVNAQNNEQTSKALGMYLSVIEIFKEAGDIVASLARGIRDATKAGVETIDIVDAEFTQSRLKELFVDLSELNNILNLGVIEFLQQIVDVAESGEFRNDEETISNINKFWDTDDGKLLWSNAQKMFGSALEFVEIAQNNLLDERSDFVLEPVYQDLMKLLRARAVALKGLESLPPPRNEEEILKFKEVLESYTDLMEKLKEANVVFGDYLKQD